MVLREEQELAVTKTLTQFLHGSKMLWDAKMRFGKTLCALEVVKRKPFNRVLILTHRPAVRDGWFKDFNLLQLPGFHYVTRVKNKLLVDGQKIAGGLEVLKQYTEHDQDYKYIYFASIQDIRGSKTVNKKSKFDKNNELFKEKWDLLIIDEAHEGIRTEQGKAVVAEFQKNKQMKSLYLSGTPYNILKLFKEKEIYRWDYNMEQDAKERWSKEHPDEKNPYEGLARLNICTYNLGEVMTNYSHDENDYFNFTEFFRVDADTDKFVHEDDVRAFLKLMTKDGENKELNYPFATSEYRDYFQHTLWSIPGVDAARCLSAILREDKEDNYFRDYEIVNIAGKGDSDIERENEDNATREKKETEALAKVQNAIRTHEKTITLTCGRCTTGVSVPEWTAVLMLSGSYETKAARYLQTIFRCQTPFKGKTKRECYAFDFAPDRTLTVIDNYLTEISRGSGSKNFGQKKAQETERFLKFCSFISIDGSKTVNFDTRSFMKQVNRAYSEEIMRGRTRKLFDNLDNISDDEFKLLKEIDARMSVSSSGKKGRGKVKVTDEGVTGERAVNASSYSGIPKETKARTKNKTKGDQAYEILEKIIIRFPMLIYGAVDKLSDSFTIDKFIKNIDNASWEEFMPREWTKTDFLKVAHVIKNERFIAWAESIFEKVNTLEGKPVDERVNGIADIISEFRYPDKETVLTPWRVVNMHLSDTVGGYDFFGEKHRDEDLLSEPRFVGEDREVTKRVFFTPAPNILELNSKTGLYPLYMAYTLYRLQCKNQQGFGPELTNEEKAAVWKKVIEKNIFVVCKTKMAERITNRTLVGFSKIKVNAKCYTDVRNNNADIIETLKNNPQHFVEDVKNGKEFWKANNNRNMKFNAVVSNPPYQVGVNKEPLYHHFISIGMEIGDLGTLIHPGRFLFNAGKTPKAWNQKMLNDEHFKVVKYWKKSDEVFDAVDIKGGVAVTMWDKQNVIGPIGTFVLHDELRTIQEKVESLGEESFSKLVYSRDLYQLTELFYKENPELEGRQSKGHRFDLGTTAFSLFPEVFSDEKPAGDGYALVVGRENDTRIAKWIKKEYLKLPDNFESYKIAFPVANGSGKFGESLSDPFVCGPYCAQNTTFLSAGNFYTLFEAQSCLKYVKTKFARCMLGIFKVTQHTTREAWRAVPLQNFTQQSDINWDLSIPELDAALYQKYNLTQDEIDFIESNVSAMQ
uniref:Eco57I restriction-modification methylase domain-containing protein n=1 Tax=Segatella hominis TaxID=2518605 RepID=UPI00403858D9